MTNIDEYVYLLIVTNKKLAIVFILLAAFCAGGTSPFSKVALHTVPPMIFTFFRFLLGSFVITIVLYKEKVAIPKPTFAVTLLTMIQVINPIIYTYGVRLTTATISQTLFSATPILTAIIAYFIIQDRLPFQKIIGIAIGFIGTLIIVFLPIIGTHSAFNGNLLGNIYVSVAVVCLAVYSVLSKQFQKTYSPLWLTAYFIYITTCVSGILAIPEFVKNHAFWTSTTLLGWSGVMYAGCIGILFFLFYQYAIKYGSPTIASVSNYLSPVVAFFVASLLLGEKLTIGFVIGALLALFGVFLVTMPTLINHQSKKAE